MKNKTITSLGACASVAVVVAACSGGSSITPSTDESTGATTSGSVAPGAILPVLPPQSGTFVFIQSTASGYLLTTLNQSSSQTVSSLDLTATGISPRSLEGYFAEPQTVSAVGTVQNDVFTGEGVYVALPGVSPAGGDQFYVAQTDRVPDYHLATELNVGSREAFTGLDITQASAPFVDQAWLSARVLAGTAIVSASLLSEGGAQSLSVSAIYLRIPDTATCAPATETCATGLVATYERDVSRCLVPTGCGRRALCPQYVPECSPGYSLARWAGPDTCPSFACDPAFDPAP